MTLDAARTHLIASLRRNGIDQAAVLAAMAQVPRERFVPAALSDQAWADRPLPIGLGQTISQPLVVAFMSQALQVEQHHRVLEIGTGCGYQTAVLAKLVDRVYTMERHRSLLTAALARLAALDLGGVEGRWGDGSQGWPEEAPFDRIMVTAAAGPEPPPALLEQLAVDGIMVLPLSESPGSGWGEQWLCRVVRSSSGFRREDLWPVRFVPLIAGPLPDDPPGGPAS